MIKKYFKIRFLFLILASFAAVIFATSTAYATHSSVSELISLHEYDDTSTFSKNLSAIHKTAFYNWSLGDGSKPEKITDKNLGNYILSGSGENIVFTALPDEPLDVYNRNNLYFVFRADTRLGEKCKIEITFRSGEETLSFTKEIPGGKYCLISMYIGTWKYRKNIDEIKISADLAGNGAYISGPYTMGDTVKANEKFMSSSLTLGSSEPEYIDKGKRNEAIKLTLDGRTVLTAIPSVSYSDEPSNSVRIIMTNSSDYEKAQFRYNSVDPRTGRTETKTSEINLIPHAERFSYIIFTGSVENIINFSIIFDGTRTGEAVIYLIEPAYMYEGYSGNSFAKITECAKSAKHDVINIVGNVDHSFFTSHDDYTLECYMLRCNDTLDTVLLRGDKPVAVSQMSSHFIFELKLSDLGTYAMTSKYIITAAAPDGGRITLCSPASVSAELASPQTDAGRTNIKGVKSSSVSLAANSGSGYAFIDIYLDKLTNASHSGHIYTIDNSFFYFSADYVSELDKKIKNLYAAGSEVYLRLLVSAEADSELIPYVNADSKSPDTEFLAVNISSPEAEKAFFAVTDFICKRYSGSTYGKISGLVLGKCVDMPNRYNYSGNTSFSDYVKTLATSFEFMARCAASNIKNINVFLPVSDIRDGTGYDTELLIASVCTYLDTYGELEFSLMLESTHSPYSINKKSFDEAVISVDESGNIAVNMPKDTPIIEKASEDSAYYSTDNLYVFERLIDYLGHLSSSAPSTYVYLWTPDIKAIGSGLSTAYIYNYYSIMFSDKAGAFIVDLCGDNEKVGIEYLANVIKYIDTDANQGAKMYLPLDDILNDSELRSAFEIYGDEMLLHRAFYKTDAACELPKDTCGEFSLWDFSLAFGSLGWFESSGCNGSSISDSELYGRTLRAQMSIPTEALYDTAELVYYFDYAEDISFAPYLCFELTADTDAESDFELTIYVCDGKSTSESSILIKSNELQKVVIDASAGGAISKITSIRICVRPTAQDVDNFDLHLKKVTANSAVFTSDALERQFETARAKARNTQSNTKNTIGPRYEAIVIAIAVLSLSILLVAFYDKNRSKNSK